MSRQPVNAEWSREFLRSSLVDDEGLQELLRLDGQARLRQCPWRLELPMADEPQIEAWKRTVERAETAATWTALRERFVQLQFPVRVGMSADPAYRRATLRGESPDADAGDLKLSQPDDLELILNPSLGGTVPVIVAPCRGDFETLVQALSLRNEPRPVPPAQGACLVNGLNDWERVRHYKERWIAARGSDGARGMWEREFAEFKRHRELYQDRFIIVGKGPYSGVNDAESGFGESDWLNASHRIRLEHECTHYFSLRAFGSLRHDLLEELVADFVGLVRTLGEYSLDLALRFLGLEGYPQYRSGGRLEVYCGDPPISEPTFELLQRVAWMGCQNLSRLASERASRLADPAELACVVTGLTALPLAALVTRRLPVLVAEAIDRIGGPSFERKR